MAVLPSAVALSSIGGQVASGPVNADFSALQVALNQLIAVLSGGSAATPFVSGNGTTLTFVAGPATIYSKTTQKDVVNTAVATDLLNGEITLAAGVLGTTKRAWCVLAGDYLNNSGGGHNLQFEIKLGATTLYKSNTFSMAASATRRAWRLEFDITEAGVTNAQWCDGEFAIGNAVAPVTGTGDIGTGDIGGPFTNGGAAAALDTTGALALVVNCIHEIANASMSMRLNKAVVVVQ